MGDLSLAGFNQVLLLAAIIIPGVAVLFWLSHVMNLLLLGKETAQSLGVNLKVVTVILLGTTSLMVSATVSQCGLLGFVGLVIPHLLRFVVGPDHRVLVPACVLGGGAYMIVCDVLARTLPRQGEMPAGVVTAIIGAPLFIFLLKKSVR
jgi:iron complex transport system permease protein